MYEGLIGPSYMDFSKKQTFVTTGVLNVHKSSVLRIQSIQILFDSLDKFAAVQYNGCLKRSDKRKIFCHLTFSMVVRVAFSRLSANRQGCGSRPVHRVF